MRKICAVALSEWLYVVRDRMAMLMLVFMPLIFTAVLGVVFGGAGNAPLRIGLVPGNQELTRTLGDVIDRDKGIIYTNLTMSKAEAGIRQATLDAAVIVPSNQTEGIKIMTDSTTQRGYDAYARIMALQATVSGRVTATALAKALLPADVNANVAGSRYAQATLPDVNVVRSWKTVAEGVLQVSPGMLVMFILMFAAFSGEGIVQERANGTWRRLMATPVSGWQYLAGRLIGKVSIGLLQFILLAAFGAVIFKVDWGSSPGMMILTGLIFTTAAAAFGLCLGVVCRTPDQLSAAATIACLAMAALGGTWWPIEATPAWLQQIGRLLPTGQAMKAFHALILFGHDGIGDVKEAWLGLAIWACMFLVLGVFLFRRGWTRGIRASIRAAG